MANSIVIPPPMCVCERCLYMVTVNNGKGDPPEWHHECHREAPPWPSTMPTNSCGRWLGLTARGHEVALLNFPTACELWGNSMLTSADVTRVES